MKYINLLILIFSITFWGCDNSTDLDVPKEIVLLDGDGNPVGVEISASFTLNDETQELEVLPNLFYCKVLRVDEVLLLNFRLEFQNPENSANLSLNSIYMRAENLSADGNEYSLSGDPAVSSNTNASKIIVKQNDVLIGQIPGQISGDDDNFICSFQKIAGSNELVGDISYKGKLKGPPFTEIRIHGFIKIKY